MIKIKLFIVTYNNTKALESCLASLQQTKLPINVVLEKNVINNHSFFQMDTTKFSDLNVWHNTLRPDFSTGHLARNWNQAIINGFENLQNPACDIVVTCQVDTIFTPNWLNFLLQHHQNYCLITACPGDGFVSYKADAIKRIGLWDERFCSIEFQEADYFTRALIFNKQWSSINDFHHSRVLNPTLLDEADRSFVYRENTDYDTHNKSTVWSPNLCNFLNSKYSKPPLQSWAGSFSNNPPQLINKQPVLYPYFEKDIIGLNDKYIW